MLNWLGKLLLGLTTISPLGFVYSILFLYEEKNWKIFILLSSISLLLVALCFKFIDYINKKVSEIEINITSAEASDRENISFILLYTMPIFTTNLDSLNIAAIVATLCLLVLFFSTGYYYQFNPVLGLCGWHFYKVSTPEGITYLLITKKHIRNTKDKRKVKQFSEYILIEGE
ncbi:hypothetical protein [Pasteurella testudinis]|uniref:hypothetical protein n=1 Tax=Pasteurella testudinis TaxID=761 RepID=UPI004058650A